MKNYKELESKCKVFAEMQADLKEMITSYECQKDYYNDPESTYHAEQRDILNMKINLAEKLMEHLDKLF